MTNEYVNEQPPLTPVKILLEIIKQVKKGFDELNLTPKQLNALKPIKEQLNALTLTREALENSKVFEIEFDQQSKKAEKLFENAVKLLLTPEHLEQLKQLKPEQVTQLVKQAEKMLEIVVTLLKAVPFSLESAPKQDLFELNHLFEELKPIMPRMFLTLLKKKLFGELTHQQKSVLIDGILADFKKKIDTETIGHYNKKTEETVRDLHKQLQAMKNAAFKEPTKQSLKTFSTKASRAINEVIPGLQSDLPWIDYLGNMLKKIINALMCVVTLGLCRSGLFAITDSVAAKMTKDMGDELDNFSPLPETLNLA